MLVHETDALLARAAWRAAVAFAREVAGPGPYAPGSVLLFVGAHGFEAVADCPLGSRKSAAATLIAAVDRGRTAHATFVYAAGDLLAAQLHRLHGCADEALVLTAAGGGAFASPPAAPLDTAGLTVREIDVLALLLARRADREIAESLVVSLATVRSHCRAVLRKLDCRDRRELWRLRAAGALGAPAARQVW